MKVFFYFLVIFSIPINSQSTSNFEEYKLFFFKYPTIGVDSSLYYTNKIFESKKPIDLAFAYTAKRHLLTLSQKQFSDPYYLSKIDYYLKKVSPISRNYLDLSHIHNIKANTARQKGDLETTLRNLEIAKDYSLKSGDIRQIIKIKGNLSGVKGDLGYVKESIKEKKETLELLNTNRKIFDSIIYKDNFNLNKISLGVLYVQAFEKGFGRKYLDSSEVVFDEILKIKLSNFDKARVFSYLGILKDHRKKYKIAIPYYLNSISLFKKIDMEANNYTNYYNLGYCYFLMKDFKNSEQYFKKVIKLKKDSVVDYNILFSNKYLANIFTIQKKDSASYYLDEFIRLYEKNTEKQKIELSKVYNQIEKRDLKYEISLLKQKNYKNLIISILIFCCIVVIFLIILITQKKIDRKKFEILINKIKNQKIETSPKVTLKIKDENEQKILEGLIKIEKEKFYLRNDFSLYTAAKKIGTNTTYLTKVIKNNKNMSFTEYTNSLRIDYISNELIQNKTLRKFNVQSIAEHVGYKNGDSFTKIFKQKTGLTPYKYIEKIAEME